MKKLIIILLLISSFAKAQIELAEDYSFKKDKIFHTTAGISISTGMFIFVNNKTNDVDLAFRSAWMTAATAGLLKEGFDVMSGKEMSIADFSYTALSGLATAFIMRGIVKHRNKKRAKRNRLLKAFLEDI